jgi:methenyltetrahydrofolate cyclohydrolase
VRGERAGTVLAPSPTPAPCPRDGFGDPCATYNRPMADPTPASSFRDLTVAEFVDLLASDAPVPGGGSASAVAAALGAALVAMVASLSEGRPKYAEHAELHAHSADVGRRLAARLLDLADQDSSAYATFAAAIKLPRGSDAETATRRAALSDAARQAAIVPLETVEACLELVAAAESLVGRSNVNASSDLDVAALLGEAAARGAGANVLINLPSVDDPSWVGETTAQVMGLLASVQEEADAVHSGVQAGESREPVEISRE